MMCLSTHWRYLALLSFVLTTYFSYAAGRHLNLTTVRIRQKRNQGAQLYLTGSYVIPGGEGGPGWGPWGTPSPCSRSCGGGVASQERRCENVDSYGNRLCQGGSKKYYSCNTQDCPEGSLDYRSEQCSSYDSTPFEGMTYQWVPYLKAPNPCELNCMPHGERFYYRHSLKVVDGTPCNEESLDICVDGECQPVGCDMMLGSNAKEDKCRECDGDGSSCKTIEGLFDSQELTSGYNDILLIPQGATNILIQEKRPSNNYLAIRNKQSEYYLNGNWRIDFPRAFTFAGAIWHYERTPQGFPAPDIIRCLGPTSEPVFLSMLYQDTNVGVKYEYSVPQGIVQNTDDEYAWVHDAFTHCSASCGGGYQLRNVSCASRRELTPVDEQLCDSALRPDTNQTCANIPCAARWKEDPWGECNAACGEGGVQSRQIYCSKIVSNGLTSIVDDDDCFQVLGPKPAQHQKCNVGLPCPTWHIGPWNPCDQLCGEGKERRNIKCYRKIDGKIEVLDDAYCRDQKPDTEKSCFIHPCDGVDWITSQWSGCDSCLSKVKTRTAHCATQKGEIYPSSFCTNHPEPELQSECDPALLPACDVQWYTSQWSKCSGKCGDGVQSRRVFCGMFNGEALQRVANGRCDASEQPEDTRVCKLEKKDCPAEWHVGPWSECSKKCGGGEQARKVMCLKENTTVPISHCEESSIMDSSQSCNTQACTEDEVLPVEPGSTMPVSDYDEDEDWCDEDDDVESVTPSMDGKFTDTSSDDLMMSDGPAYDTSVYSTDDDYTTDFSGDEGTDTDIVLDYGSGEHSTMEGEVTTEDGITTDSSTDISGVTKSSDEFTSTESMTELTSFSETSTSSDISTTQESSTDSSSSTDASASTESSTYGSTDASSIESSSESSTDSTGISSTDVSSTDASSTDISSTDFSVTEISSTDISSTDGSTTDSSDMTSTDISSTDSSSTEISSTDASSTDMSSTDMSSTDMSSTDISSTDMSSTDSSSTDSSSTDSSSTDSSSTDSSSTDISSTDMSSTEMSSTDMSSTDLSSTDASSTDSSSTDSSASTPDTSTYFASTTEEGYSTTDSTDKTTEFSTESSTEISSDFSSSESSSESTTEFESSSVYGTTEMSFRSTDESTTECTTDISSTDGDLTKMTSTDISSTDMSSTTDVTIDTTTNDGTTDMTTSDGTIDTTTTDMSTSTEFGSSTESSSESITMKPRWGSSIPWTPTGEKKCKRKLKKPVCLKSKFGCCFDNKTAAEGPFEKGCPSPKTCKETKHGCCPNGVSPAEGPKDKGCPTQPCNETLYGCCSDNKTVAEGNNDEGCPPPPPACKSSKYGCCADEETEAVGPKKKGCPETLSASTGLPVDCFESDYGCCDDNATEASGPEKEGCSCTTYPHGCCQDQVSIATGPNFEGCVGCNSSTFGCCPDQETPAHGPNGEGCCLTQPHGCCPDNIVAARGPDNEGCGCQWSPYGCCPDNQTAARGYYNEGCGCQHTSHGCCPNRYTPALGPDFEGCPCYTYQFGCCPDGKRVARGPRYQGCGCQDSEFGCCSDGQTAALGPENAGCDCSASKFGCCPDGIHDAKGDDFEGCEDKPADLQASCKLDKDRGSCRNYTVKWYYDMEYGGCSRFWYGGCEGNDNKFANIETCKDVCMEPQGRDRCKLPKVKGPCTGYYPTWYYDTERKHCSQFIYGGCLGNNNRFPNREDCQKLCEMTTEEDVCTLETDPGTCLGNHQRWSFNKENGRCEPFTWGGCHGNANRFVSESACIMQCDTPGKMKAQDICTLPSQTGDCDDYRERWFYDSAEKRCRQFYYGGCGGNSNNFPTENECEARCNEKQITTTEQPQEPFQSEFCFLPSEVGPCRASTTRWHYDSTDGVCKQFLYGGCGGNRNNFEEKEECESHCSNVQDLCQLPMAVGPCSGSYSQWFYDKNTDSCSQFAYGGCQGNNNRFTSRDECEQRCKRGPVGTTDDPNAISTVTEHPEDVLPDMCNAPMQSGNCEEEVASWFYNPRSGACESFLYTGCGGNSNRFLSEEQCQRQCGNLRRIEVCRYQKETGPCRASFRKFYYDESRGHCLEFIWGGCGGSPNRFSSDAECMAVCTERRELSPDTSKAMDKTICQLQVDSGNCIGTAYKRWYYDDDTKDCIAFIYTGCAGNANNFRNYESCLKACFPRNKPGECPASIDEVDQNAVAPVGERCDRECYTDADCTGDDKCCRQGCAMVCVAPKDQYQPAYTVSPHTNYLPGVEAPRVDELQEAEVEAEEGNVATLRCLVYGNPSPTITWKKESIIIDGTSGRHKILTDGTLQIISLYRNDSGVYICIAENGIGAPVQREVNLQVKVPVKVNITYEKKRFPVGADLSLHCNVDGYPTPDVTWTKNGVALASGGRLDISESHRLIISRVNSSDSGEYRCDAKNQYSSAYSSLRITIDGVYIDENCVDNPFLANCNLIVKAKYCNHKYYGRFCCRSCTLDGQLPSISPQQNSRGVA